MAPPKVSQSRTGHGAACIGFPQVTTPAVYSEGNKEAPYYRVHLHVRLESFLPLPCGFSWLVVVPLTGAGALPDQDVPPQHRQAGAHLP